MRRGDDFRSSFSFGGSHDTHQSSGGGASDAKTAAQLRKLQRLVETLVVRELERGEAPAEGPPRQGTRSRHATQTQQPLTQPHGLISHRGDSSGGGGRSRAARQTAERLSSAESDGWSTDARHNRSGGGGGAAGDPMLHGPYGRRGSGGTGAAATAAAVGRAAAGRPGGGQGVELDEGVHMQVSALQGQLAVLSEQLNVAYRAAEGPSAAVPGAGSSALPVTSLRQPQGLFGSGGGAMVSGVDPAASRGPTTFSSGPVRSLSPSGMSAAAQHLLGPALAAGTTRAAGSPLPLRPAVSGGGGGGGGASAGGAGSDSAAVDGLSGGSGSHRLRHVVEERAGREASAREDERLRSWIQELRTERRRLEDRLLDGDNGGATGLQQLRDDLEKQVLSLSRQRDQLAAELHELGATQATNRQLAGQVEALEGALAAEADRVARYKEIRPALEGRLAEASASLEALRRQHVAAVDALAQERDAALLRAKRGSKRVLELEGSLDNANADIRRLQDEVRTHLVTLAEMRASSDVLQSASQQMQAGMEAQAKEAASRLAAVQSQLESSQSEVVILRRQLEAAQQTAAALRDQLKDAHSRLEAQGADRERLAGSLAEEQRATAAVKQQVESLAVQLKVSEEARADAGRAAAAQLEAVRRQHAADMAATQKQYESQLAVAEKQYLLLQRQYDAGLASNGMASEAAAALRRERDALWAETQNLRAELEDVRKEKVDATAKLSALRSEVRATMEEVARDRDARLAAAAASNEALVRDVHVEAERRVAAVKQEYEAKLSSVMDAADKMREEVQDAQRQSDKFRTTVNHLKDQVRDLLLSRDAAERELASERAFNEELNRILTTIRAEQQQHQLHQQLQHHTPGLRLSSPAD